ncbi:MAG: hypothetical protein LIQ31_13355, partial [Planctomycetes bacterium]|nr:hypothetical protein [Planctomycetota bacterium]
CHAAVRRTRSITCPCGSGKNFDMDDRRLSIYFSSGFGFAFSTFFLFLNFLFLIATNMFSAAGKET